MAQRRGPQPAPTSRLRLPILFAIIVVVGLAAAAGALWLRVSGEESIVLPTETRYTEAVAGTWLRVNPLYANANQVDQDIVQLVFAGLLQLSGDGSPAPLLAELPEVSSDGRTYTFRLKSGLQWPDGQPLTTEDVAFTIARVQDGDFRGDPALAGQWQGIETEVPDATTVVFRLAEPYAPFVVRNATLGILPAHLLAGKTGGQLVDDPFNTAPVGAGPYVLESLNSQEAVLKANDKFALGRPKIDKVVLRFYSDYPSALRAVQDGAVDGLYYRDTINASVLAQFGELEGYTISGAQSATALVLYLNNDTAGLFDDERVRRAISLALDRNSLVDVQLQGYGQASDSIIAPMTWAYSQDDDSSGSPNLAEARRLLEEAGWKAHATTGVLAREGSEFQFTIRTDNDAVRVAVATQIAQQLEPLGIRATVASTTFAVLRRDYLQERKYDAAIAAWDQGTDPDPYPGWHSSQTGSAGLNLANFADAVADELMAKARTTADPEVRSDLYHQFQAQWSELAPSAVLFYSSSAYIRADDVEAAEPGVVFLPANRFAGIQEWSR